MVEHNLDYLLLYSAIEGVDIFFEGYVVEWFGGVRRRHCQSYRSGWNQMLQNLESDVWQVEVGIDLQALVAN